MPQTAKKAAEAAQDTQPEGATAKDLLAASQGNVTPIGADVEVKPDAAAVKAALAEAGERNKQAQSAARKANGTSTTKPDAAKPARKPKAAAKPKAATKVSTVERVPAAEVIALIDELGITRSQLAAAVGKSPSLVSEWVGKGRGHLAARSEWKAIEATARKFAKGLK